MSKSTVGARENVTVVFSDAEGNVKHIVKGKNIVTNDGDTAYAQMIVGEGSNFDTPFLRLGTSGTAVSKTDTDVTTFISGSDLALDVGFPQRNNADPGNTDGGVDVITWKFSYALGDLNTTGIAEGAIVNNGTTPTSALNHFLFAAPFDVTSTDQLTVYVNHTFNGIA
jgi:hypothetical protein